MKAVVITGAGSGIGAACAREARCGGYGVVLSGRRAELLEEVAAELEHVIVVPGDVTEPDHGTALAEAARASFGGPDAVVLNAGVGEFGRRQATTRRRDGSARSGSTYRCLPRRPRGLPRRRAAWRTRRGSRSNALLRASPDDRRTRPRGGPLDARRRSRTTTGGTESGRTPSPPAGCGRRWVMQRWMGWRACAGSTAALRADACTRAAATAR